MKRLLLFLLLVLLPGWAQAQVTQREWALQLIDSLGWSYGLPEKPTDEDYAQILSGERLYRIEAEDAYQRGDRVAVMNFKTFGEFSGSGWLNGTKNLAEVHFKFNLPHAGRYKLRARVRLTEHHLIFGTRDLRVSGGGQFSNVEIGYVELQAGAQEVRMLLRPNGSIDYFELEAEPFGMIRPEGGWEFDRELTPAVAAQTAIQALNLQRYLPPGRKNLKLEAENLPLPAEVRVMSGTNKGEANGGRYVEVGPAPVKVVFYTTSIGGEVADLTLRAAASRPVAIKLPGHFEMRKSFERRLEDQYLGTYFLPEGEIFVEVSLPPGAVLDSLEVRTRRASQADLLRLAGLSEAQQLSERDLNNLTTLIYRLRTLR